MIDGTVFLLAPSAAGFGFVAWAMRRDRLATARRPLSAPAPAPAAAPKAVASLVVREAA